jgi:hypothetical protein
MNTQIALHTTIGGVPVILEGVLPGAEGGEAQYTALVDCHGLDLESVLRALLSSFAAPANGFAFPAVRLETLRVTLNGKTGWLSVSLRAQDLELFLLLQMKDESKHYALGMRTTKPIYLGELPWLDQYKTEFPELKKICIENLGFLYASGPDSYPFPCTDGTPDAERAAEKFDIVRSGSYSWIAQNIIPPHQPLWIPPLKPPGTDQEQTGKAPAAEVKPEIDERSQENSQPSKQDDTGIVLADSTGEPKISWLNLNKSIGPFTLSRMGGSFNIEKMEASILLDASVSAAGITLSLYGLGLHTPINPITPQLTLSGMGLSFSRSPIELSGGLVTSDLGKSFFGNVLVRVKGIGLSAIGAYYNQENYKSLFVFGMLELPLGGPPAFFVTGLAAGFGYHSRLTLPAVSELSNFVLVKGALPALPGSGNPFADKKNNDLLETLVNESPANIQPSEGENWMAAGVRFTSFEMIQSFALVTISFGTRVEIALLGRSQMSIPPRLPGATEEPYALAFVEIDLKAVIEPDAEDETPVLAVSGIIAADSYVFAKGCRLTGGFAFYVWKSGEFIVTFGGYHPKFQSPSNYPTVGRLGFVWQVNGNLYTQGGLYLALTGSGIMAGFDMQAVFQSGPIVASFTARADFLMSWKPFHYEASIFVQIRFALHLNLGLLTTSLSYQVGVGLDLYGPPFGGIAHVNIGVISFDIPFGVEKSQPPEALTWNTFAETFLPPDNTTAPLSEGTRPRLVQWARVTGGLIKETTDPTTKEHVWIINPRDFEITTYSGVPATEICYWAEPGSDPIGPSKVGILPMRINNITSVHRITIQRLNEDEEWVPYKNAPITLMVEPVLGKSPRALYNPGPIDDQITDSAMIDNTVLGLKIKPARRVPGTMLSRRISELLLGENDDMREGNVVPCQGFTDSAIPTDDRQSLANHLDLTGEPEQDFLDALKNAGFMQFANNGRSR